MGLLAAVRWICFLLYPAVLALLPLTLLWGAQGAVIGLAGAVGWLILIRRHGVEKIAARLGARPLSPGEIPHLYGILQEYCRRMRLVPPRLWIIDGPGVNAAGFGFSPRAGHVVVTRGLLERLPREALAAVVALQLCRIRRGDVVGDSWMSQVLAFLDRWLRVGKSRRQTERLRARDPFRLFVRQALLYVLAWLPGQLLHSRSRDKEVDEEVVAMTGNSLALSEGLRLIEAMAERLPVVIPFSTRHLLLLPPHPGDAFAQTILEKRDLGERVGALRKLTQVVPVP